MKKQLTALMSTLMLTTATLGVVSCMSNNAVAMEPETVQDKVASLISQVLAPGSEEVKKTYYNNNWVKHPPLNSQQWYTNQIWASGEKVYNKHHSEIMKLAGENSNQSWILEAMVQYKGRLQLWVDAITDPKIEEFFNGAQWSTRNDKTTQLTGHKQFAVTYRKNLHTIRS